MPSKIRPDDLDRLFVPNAPRRGGPLRGLLNIVLAVVILALLAGGVAFALDLRQQRYAQAVATATAFAPTAAAARAATAAAEQQATATLVAARTATAIARQSTAIPQSTLIAMVFNGGNVREAPVNGRPIDQIKAGETVQLLEKTGDGAWFRISYARDGQTITGWASKTLLTIEPAVEQGVPVHR